MRMSLQRKNFSDMITGEQIETLKMYQNYLINLRKYYYYPSNTPRIKYEIIRGSRGQKSNSMDRNQMKIRLPNNEFDTNIRELYECDSTNPPDRWRDEDKICVKNIDEDKKILLLERKPKTGEIQIRFNTNQITVQINAIDSLLNKPIDQYHPLLSLFQRHREVTWPQVTSEEIKEWFFLDNDDYEGVNEQRRFVRIAMGTPDFAFLDGPPGSGKTTILCELVQQMIMQGKRVLICGSTHVSVDNLIEKLAEGDKKRKNSDMMILRIGDSGKVSEYAERFLYDKVIENTRREMSRYLINKQPKTAASKILEVALREDSAQPDDENGIVGSLVRDCFNVVCGTSIGILQYPDIKKNKDTKSRRFDMMILDEASKTTLQEFLVPALYADRWIIVGDVRQLAPYTDQKSVDVNIKNCIDSDLGQVCLDVFEANKNRDNHIVIVTNDDTTKLRYEEQCRDLKIKFFDADRDKNMNSSQIIVGSPESLSRIKPPSGKTTIRHIELLNELLNELPHKQKKNRKKNNNRYLENQIKNIKAWKKKHSENDSTESSWSDQVGWRLARNYESIPPDKRSDVSIKGNYHNEIYDLMPAYSIENSQKVRDEIDNVMTVAFPSILESIQYGVGENTRSQNNTISDGMPEDDFEERHVLLTNQYRMHRQIAEFSHKYIYEENALFTPDSIDSKREWTYSRYMNRMIWIDICGKYDDRRSERRQDV